MEQVNDLAKAAQFSSADAASSVAPTAHRAAAKPTERTRAAFDRSADLAAQATGQCGSPSDAAAALDHAHSGFPFVS
jgi:hypothetical protein